MRAILLILASMLVAAGAYAGGAALDPVKLAVQRSNVPRTTDLAADAHRIDPLDLADLDVHGLKGAEYSYAWPAGGAGRHWRLAGAVFVAPTSSGAQTLYKHATKLRYGIPLIDLLYPPQHQAVLSLPRYGDEQLGIAGDPSGSPAATLYVRKGTVVWALTIDHFPDSWKVTKAQVLGQLKVYAHKQAARIVAG